MSKKFNINEFRAALRQPLNESSVAVQATPEKLKLYNLIRGRLLGIVATNPISSPEAYVFGKTRTISGVNALEYSQDTDTENYVSNVFYNTGEKFKFADTIFVVKRPFTLTFADEFELKTKVYALEQQDFIEVDQLSAEFGISKLAVIASNQKSVLNITNDLLHDVDYIYGRSVLNDALADTAAERVNRAAVRLLESSAVLGPGFSVIAGDYKEARSLAGRIQDEAQKVIRDTGNVPTYVFVTPRTYSLLSQSGLIDKGWLGDLEVIQSRYYHTEGYEYFIVGFARNLDDRGEHEDTIGDAPYEYGSVIFAPYVDQLIDVIDTENFSSNFLMQMRFGMSVAPYKEEKSYVLGNSPVHFAQNLNARRVDLSFA